MNYKLFTSESVCAGHPDKICDQISDAILDACLSQDPKSRVAVETLVTTNRVVLAGEVTTCAKVDFEKIARDVIRDLGYTNGFCDFNWKTAEINVHIHKQSPDIALGVDSEGAGDQGMMFGYATTDTKNYLPLPIELAHAICKGLDEARIKKTIPYLRPDGKSQITVEYEDGKPKNVTNVVIAAPHDPKVSHDQVKKDIFKKIVKVVLKKYGCKVDFEDFICNGTGKWEIGGPASDTGVTGRKIAVDSYGSVAKIGGGAFSGKDPTKVDRSGAYAARFIAKNIVARGLADVVELQIAYAIGQKYPVSFAIETFGTQKVEVSKIEEFAKNLLDLSVSGILNGLDLRRPIYRQTASYGHFGRPEFPWEKIVK